MTKKEARSLLSYFVSRARDARNQVREARRRRLLCEDSASLPDFEENYYYGQSRAFLICAKALYNEARLKKARFSKAKVKEGA